MALLMIVFSFPFLSLFPDDLEPLITNVLTHPSSSCWKRNRDCGFPTINFYPLYLYTHPAFSQFYLDGSRFPERICIVAGLCLGCGEATDSSGPNWCEGGCEFVRPGGCAGFTHFWKNNVGVASRFAEMSIGCLEDVSCPSPLAGTRGNHESV